MTSKRRWNAEKGTLDEKLTSIHSLQHSYSEEPNKLSSPNIQQLLKAKRQMKTISNRH